MSGGKPWRCPHCGQFFQPTREELERHTQRCGNIKDWGPKRMRAWRRAISQRLQQLGTGICIPNVIVPGNGGVPKYIARSRCRQLFFTKDMIPVVRKRRAKQNGDVKLLIWAIYDVLLGAVPYWRSSSQVAAQITEKIHGFDITTHHVSYAFRGLRMLGYVESRLSADSHGPMLWRAVA